MFLSRHSFEGVNVSATPSNGDAYLPLIHDEYCAFLFFIDYTIFDACATYAFKQSDITHFVGRDLYAVCHQVPPECSCISLLSIALRISESPVSLILNAEIMKSLLHTSA